MDFRNFDDMRRLATFVREVSFGDAVPFAAMVSAMGLARHGTRGWRRALPALVKGLAWVRTSNRQLTQQQLAIMFWASFYSYLPDEAVRFIGTLATTITDTGRGRHAGAAGPLGEDAVRTTVAVLEALAQKPGMFDPLEDYVKAARDARAFGWVRK